MLLGNDVLTAVQFQLKMNCTLYCVSLALMITDVGTSDQSISISQ